MPFLHLHLAAKHAVDEDKIADYENGSERPPSQADTQSVSAGSGVVDGKVVLVVAGGKYDGIERKRRACQHRGDIQAGSNERKFLLALGIRPEHYRQAGDYNDRNQYPDLVLGIVRHDFGPYEVSRNQGTEGQKKLRRPAQQRKPAGPAAEILVGFEGDVVRTVRGQSH